MSEAILNMLVELILSMAKDQIKGPK